MKKLLLIDGNSILFRAYHATLYTQMMRTSSGIATNAVYGFVNMFLKALDIIQPDGILVAFDAGKKNFRHDQFTEYKGTRKEVDQDLIIQFPIVREFLDDLGVKRLEVLGYEADDIIGSLAKTHPEWETIILTSDRDMLQLIDASTNVLLIKKGMSDLLKMDEAMLFETYGLAPKQIIDLKALMGDTADNIPGVKGIGEKTATKLLQSYGTLDGIYQNVDELKGKMKEKIIADEANARMSYELATIYCDLTFDLHGNDFILHPNYEKLKEFYIKYEMNSFVKKIDRILEDTKVKEVETTTCEVVTTMPKQAYMEQHTLQFIFTKKDSCFGVVLATPSTVYYQELHEVKKDTMFLEYLLHPTQSIMFDSKLQVRKMEPYFRLGLASFDVLIAAFVLDSTVSSLEKVYAKYEVHPEYLNDLFDKKQVEIVDQDYYLHAIVEQSMNLWKLYECVNKEFDEDTKALYETVDYPLSRVLLEMEQVGIQVDAKQLKEIELDLENQLKILEGEIHALAGHPFNISSPKQLATVLFDELGLKANKKRSTAVDILEKLVHAHPMIEKLMEHRKVSKVYSTYAIGLAKHIQKDQRIHTIYNQCLAQTGRLSSVEPNLQNISVRDEVGKQIRKAFVAREGYTLLSADYSQIELRVLASIANETQMIHAFNEGIDIHLQTAMAIYHKTANEVTSEDRRNAKAVNFGIVYGISDFGLAENIDITVIEARQFIEKYFDLYPNIRKFMDEVVDEAKEKGYVETLLHRKRYIPELYSSNYQMREFGKRVAMNSPIQGSAADLIKLAMINVDSKMKEANVESKMILQVHDELIFEVKDEELEQMTALVIEGMQEAMKLNVELEAQVSLGKSWYEAK